MSFSLGICFWYRFLCVLQIKRSSRKQGNHLRVKCGQAMPPDRIRGQVLGPVVHRFLGVLGAVYFLFFR